MIRNVDLVSYLPPFLSGFKEISVALESENPEFKIVWDAVNRTLKNEFIATADEHGISRFENILKILPLKEDTLETRRARVQSQWFNSIPSTVKGLISKLNVICDDANLILNKDFENYLIEIEIEKEGEFFRQPEQAKNIMEAMIPCNMKYNNYISSKIPMFLSFDREFYSTDLPLCGQYICGQIPFSGGV